MKEPYIDLYRWGTENIISVCGKCLILCEDCVNKQFTTLTMALWAHCWRFCELFEDLCLRAYFLPSPIKVTDICKYLYFGVVLNCRLKDWVRGAVTFSSLGIAFRLLLSWEVGSLIWRLTLTIFIKRLLLLTSCCSGARGREDVVECSEQWTKLRSCTSFTVTMERM